MKELRTSAIIFIGFATVLMISCQKRPLANISIDKQEVEINETVTFINSSINSKNYFWDFGDGQTSTEFSPQHAWEKPGDYKVTMTAYSDDKYSSMHSVNVRVTGYSYKFCGTYSGVNVYSGCRSGNESVNIIISSSLFENTFNILNLDNKFASVFGTVSGTGDVFYIPSQKDVKANDGSLWDIESMTGFIDRHGNTLHLSYLIKNKTCSYNSSVTAAKTGDSCVNIVVMR